MKILHLKHLGSLTIDNLVKLTKIQNSRGPFGIDTTRIDLNVCTFINYLYNNHALLKFSAFSKIPILIAEYFITRRKKRLLT